MLITDDQIADSNPPGAMGEERERARKSACLECVPEPVKDARGFEKIVRYLWTHKKSRMCGLDNERTNRRVLRGQAGSSGARRCGFGLEPLRIVAPKGKEAFPNLERWEKLIRVPNDRFDVDADPAAALADQNEFRLDARTDATGALRHDKGPLSAV
jgi:hypothetical protein